MANDEEMRDADAVDEEQRQYLRGPISVEELDEKYPNRPRNHSKTLPFHELFTTLFNPLNEGRKKPIGAVIARRKQGPHGPKNLTPHESRREIIERFISRWRKEVGNDIYPAFRLIIPEKDRDRAMYGLKEKTIAKLILSIMGIDSNSEDGHALLNWKQPGLKAKSAMAGDFAGRCYEVIVKRQSSSHVGDMTIGDVNEMLDKLSIGSKEEDQKPILKQFFLRMNAEEMMWLIRIVLRQMKVGATEKTIFDIWHPDAENLYNVSSSLRRVCWELYNPQIRLDGEVRGITLMQCFQPQLAAFQMNSIEKMVSKMKMTDEDPTFWIEEKLDGERMQLHMIEDEDGQKRFNFWSRKAKDYTYLYGSNFHNGALTWHLKDAFNEDVRNIILDGEMITWDVQLDKIVGFGTLKTAAIATEKDPHSTGEKPLFKVFDCLYLNDECISNYTLRDRRAALKASIKRHDHDGQDGRSCTCHGIHRRLEVHEYTVGRTAAEVEPILRTVVEEASEGLVIKNPRSMYRLNERNDDWIKVKPEYMTEFGEELDCVVLGGYYGSGRRGGWFSSFLCGLRLDETKTPPQFLSFFKVGGGFTKGDYNTIKGQTEGKWHKFDRNNPPNDILVLAGDKKFYEAPDEWIKPEDSFVVSAKAASVANTDRFATKFTLRFPRFKKLRPDKNWQSALTLSGFIQLKANAEQEHKQKQFTIDDSRKQRNKITRKRKLVVSGHNDVVTTPYAGPNTKVFEGLTFYVITDATQPEKKTKAELEQIVKANGGRLIQTHNTSEHVICIADRRNIRVRTVESTKQYTIVRPVWLFDTINQSQLDIGKRNFLLPYEPRHTFSTIEKDAADVEASVDEYGDSYARDITAEELRTLLETMPTLEQSFDKSEFVEQVEANGLNAEELPAWMFRDVVVYLDKPWADANSVTDLPVQTKPLDIELELADQIITFCGGRVLGSLDDLSITHILVGEDRSRISNMRKEVAKRATSRIPRIVPLDWVRDSWTEKTLLDESRYHVS
ncbi:ATP-dependent DNA ligase [Patellaria atrata CBS 101060]|uniref:DNA ligase n=1 Tax=Patellaria atrata CBS 101060 TaxID=1346257 RepID=A0A9P4VS84_9PEZI|nr:ATP-dependent DNA ligase [Patellaria atrata CBS 101060]